MKTRRQLLLGAAALAVAGGLRGEEDTLWPAIRRSGVLKVAFYNDFAPFSDDGKGADVDIGGALAALMGLKMSPMFFDADENMDDDLRNMVWKGHYMGYGPADLMMHAPVDRDYMARQDKVDFIAPYHRERYAVAYDRDKVDRLESMQPFEQLDFGVVVDTLPDTLMLSADGGRYRSRIRHFATLDLAVKALRAGEIAGVMALQGELEAAVAGSPRFAVVAPPLALLNTRQWPVGIAVRRGEPELARSIMAAISELAANGEIGAIMAKHRVVWRKP